MNSRFQEIIHPIQSVNNVKIQVIELAWFSGGKSFDVYAVSDGGTVGDCLTEVESFDTYPTDEQIANVLP
jgi:hypothetical protein